VCQSTGWLCPRKRSYPRQSKPFGGNCGISPGAKTDDTITARTAIITDDERPFVHYGERKRHDKGHKSIDLLRNRLEVIISCHVFRDGSAQLRLSVVLIDAQGRSLIVTREPLVVPRVRAYMLGCPLRCAFLCGVLRGDAFFCRDVGLKIDVIIGIIYPRSLCPLHGVAIATSVPSIQPSLWQISCMPRKIGSWRSLACR